MKIVLTLILLLLSSDLFAKGGSGVSAQGSLGMPSSQITNADGTNAYYSGISLRGDLGIPIYATAAFGTELRLNLKYLDLPNSASTATQRETGNHIGAGAGIRLNFYRLFVAMDFNAMKARHFFVGDINKYIEYDYSVSSTSIGMEFSTSKTFSAVLTYSMNSGTVPKSATGFNQDSAYSDTVIWLGVKYKTGLPFGKFMASIFK